MDKSIKISSESYNKLKEIAKSKNRKYTQILDYAINNYWKITLGNSSKKG